MAAAAAAAAAASPTHLPLTYRGDWRLDPIGANNSHSTAADSLASRRSWPIESGTEVSDSDDGRSMNEPSIHRMLLSSSSLWGNVILFDKRCNSYDRHRATLPSTVSRYCLTLAPMPALPRALRPLQATRSLPDSSSTGLRYGALHCAALVETLAPMIMMILSMSTGADRSARSADLRSMTAACRSVCLHLGALGAPTTSVVLFTSVRLQATPLLVHR